MTISPDLRRTCEELIGAFLAHDPAARERELRIFGLICDLGDPEAPVMETIGRRRAAEAEPEAELEPTDELLTRLDMLWPPAGADEPRD